MSISFAIFLQEYEHLTFFSLKEIKDIYNNFGRLYKMLDLAAEIEYSVAKYLYKQKPLQINLPYNLGVYFNAYITIHKDVTIGNITFKETYESERYLGGRDYLGRAKHAINYSFLESKKEMKDDMNVCIIKLTIKYGDYYYSLLGDREYDKIHEKHVLYFRRICEYRKFRDLVEKNRIKNLKINIKN